MKVYEYSKDFVALYPTIRRDLLPLAVRHALQTSEYTEDSINMILDLVSLSIENSVVFFRGIWYKSLIGLPTGGPESNTLANIFCKWLLEQKLLTQQSVSAKFLSQHRYRFLDDIFLGRWMGVRDSSPCSLIV